MSSQPLFKFILHLFGAILLLQCTTVSSITSNRSVDNRTAYTSPDAYLALADDQRGDEKQSLQIMAAAQYIEDGQWKQGKELLNKLNDLNPELSIKKQLLLAKVDLMRSKPRKALSRLSAVREISSWPLDYQAQYYEMLANAYQLVGNASESIAERIKLDSMLTNDAEKNANLRALWQTLNTLPPAELNTLAVESSDNINIEGWVKLALIYRKSPNVNSAILAEIDNWKEVYPQHAAQSILNSTQSSQRVFSPPNHMALLLPLSGPLTGPGNAVRDGFMAAHKASGKAEEITVNFYDTNLASSVSLYQKAIAEGADYIVGPLVKSDAANVAKLEHPVPTVLLNELNFPSKENVYQFSLSPSNEGKQVASKIAAQGHSRVLVIAPAGAWGEDIALTFSHQLQSEGGKVVDNLFFSSTEDLSKAVRDILRINASEQRGKQLKELLGYNMETLPSRRQDFDAIFLVAYPSKARQIMPLLKYYYVEDVPVYATSTVFAGYKNTMRDRDLDGIVFCDMPWVFKNQRIQKNWPEQFNSYNRLYALGMDSFTLAVQLNDLDISPRAQLKNKSGSLYIDPNQRIGRSLAWGRFTQGVAQLTG